MRWIGGTCCVLALGCGSAPVELSRAAPAESVADPGAHPGDAESAPEEPSRPADDVRTRIAAARATLEAGGQLGNPALEAANALAELPIEDAREREELSEVLLAAWGPVDRSDELDDSVVIAFIHALGTLATSTSVARLLEALVPCRTYSGDVKAAARLALVRIGRPALEPLLQMLSGANARVNAASIRCAGRRVPSAENAPRVDDWIVIEAAFALGDLGFEESLEPLLAVTRHSNADRRLAAACALRGLPRSRSNDARIRDAIVAVYRRADQADAWTSVTSAEILLLRALEARGDAGVMRFVRGEAERATVGQSDRRFSWIRPQIAFEVALSLADASDVPALRAMLGRTDAAWGTVSCLAGPDPFVAKARAVLAAIDRCRGELACWRGAIDDPDPNVIAKALAMTARYGRGDTESIAAIARALDHADNGVRARAYEALDLAAPSGDIAAIAAMAAREPRENEPLSSMPFVHQLTQGRLAHRVADDPEAAPRLSRSRALYREWCTNCHSEDGSPVATGTPTPTRSIANLGRTEAVMHRNLDVIGRRFRHPMPSAEHWQGLAPFLRQLGTHD